MDAILLKIEGTEDIAGYLKPDDVLALIRCAKKQYRALQQIADLTPEMIDTLPLDRAFRSLRDATKIARQALG